MRSRRSRLTPLLGLLPAAIDDKRPKDHVGHEIGGA